jgi:hypothetical protein
MSAVHLHLQMLGFNAKDRVTGFSGVVSSICFDLYGCVQAALRPPSTTRAKRRTAAGSTSPVCRRPANG